VYASVLPLNTQSVFVKPFITLIPYPFSLRAKGRNAVFCLSSLSLRERERG
jgi:hypothetical protein